MTPYLVVPALFLIAVLQASAIPHARVWGVFPDLPLIVVAMWGLLAGAKGGAEWGLVSGLAVDLLSGAPLGAATVPMVLVGLAAGLAHRASRRGIWALSLAVALASTLLYDFAFLLALAVSGRPVTWGVAVTRVVLPSAVLNLLIALPLYGLLYVLHHRFFRREMAL